MTFGCLIISLPQASISLTCCHKYLFIHLRNEKLLSGKILCRCVRRKLQWSITVIYPSFEHAHITEGLDLFVLYHESHKQMIVHFIVQCAVHLFSSDLKARLNIGNVVASTLFKLCELGMNSEFSVFCVVSQLTVFYSSFSHLCYFPYHCKRLLRR